MPTESPCLVQVLDEIRFKNFDKDEWSEFLWFIREYPRVFRYHFSNVQHRLSCIHARYERFHAYFSRKLSTESGEAFQFSLSDTAVHEIYWDFEALLNAVCSGLDVLARVLSTAYKDHTPPSFNKLAAKSDLGGYVHVFNAAKNSWVKQLKDYRDCFVHYTSVDTFLSCSCSRYSNGWQVRCKLPTNPNVRDIIGFRWSRRCEVLQKAISMYRKFEAFDRSIAGQIKQDYAAGLYPVRIEHLFMVGQRSRPEIRKRSLPERC